MKKLLIFIMIKFYKINNRKIRKIIEKVVIKLDGEPFWNLSLRKIYELYYDIHIGIGSYGCFDINRFPEGTQIGNYCSFAAESRYLRANHPMDFVSTHPLFYNKMLKGVEEDKIRRGKLVVGHDVWVGYGVMILPGCKKIGNGAVIGAGSIVTSDIEPYGIYVGTPAKLVRKRFSQEIIDKLEKSRWYEESPEMLLKYKKEIENPEEFIVMYEKNIYKSTNEVGV